MVKSIFSTGISVILALALLGSREARAEGTVLVICNQNTDRAIFSSYMWGLGGSTGWQSKGWFKVAKSSCTNLSLGTYSGTVYLYAQDEFGVSNWGEGSKQYCVNKTDAFTINNADTDPCTGSAFMKVNSDALTVKPGQTTWTVNPNFSQLKFCNRNSTLSVDATFARPVNGSLTSQGWFSVPAGQCTTVPVGKYTGAIEYYGQHNGGQFAWTGTTHQYCVNQTVAFQISGADQESNCRDSSLKMIMARDSTVQIGINEVDFEAVSLSSTLVLCNHTPDKVLNASYAMPVMGLWQSKGWIALQPQSCSNVDLGTYAGEVHLYAEWNHGESYWGTGPFNYCVNQNQNFTIADGANASACNSVAGQKMIPSSQINVVLGTNEFDFNP